MSWNCEQCINSVLHVFGDQPYRVTEAAGECDARNNKWLTLAMLGENWCGICESYPITTP